MSNVIRYSVANADIIIDSNARAKAFFSPIIKGETSESSDSLHDKNYYEGIEKAAYKKANEIIDSANEQKKLIIEQALNEAESKKKEIEDMARESGYNDGYKKVNAEYEEKLKKLKEERKKLISEYKAEVKRLEPLFANFTIKCVEKLTGVVASEYKSVIYNILVSAINNTATGKSYIIHVPKEQFEYVNERADAIKSIVGDHVNVEIIADRSLAINNCKIETDYCIIDTGLDTRLTTLKNSIKLLAGIKE